MAILLPSFLRKADRNTATMIATETYTILQNIASKWFSLKRYSVLTYLGLGLFMSVKINGIH